MHSALTGRERVERPAVDRDVGLVRVDAADQVVARVVLRDDLEARADQQRRDPLAHEHAVIGDHDARGDAIAQDLGVAPDALEPQMAAAATVPIFAQLGDYLDGDLDDEAQRAAALALVDRALVFIAGGVSALRSGR